MSVATATIIGIGVAAGTAGAGIYAANKSSSAATAGAKTNADAQTTAAKLQTDAANHAADLQSQSAAAGLAYTKQQADQTQANFNTTQRANYDQWASAQHRLGTLGEMVGLGAREIPGYVPPTTATAPGAAPTAPGAAPTAPGAAPAPGVPPTAASASAVPGGDYRAWFNTLTGGQPLDQDGLLALKPQIEAVGGEITPPSQAGVVSKVRFPGTPWVRVLDGDTSQKNPTVWMPQPSVSSAPAYGAASSSILPTLGAAWQPPVTTPIGGTLTLPPVRPTPGTLGYLAGAR